MRIVTNKEVKYCFIVFLIYGLVFEFALMSIHPMFKYIDELYAILFVPLGIKYFFSLDQIINKKIFLLILLFVLLGVSTNIVYGYQNIQAVMKDIFLNIKFFMGIVTIQLLTKKFDVQNYRKRFIFHIKAIIIILFVLMLVDQITPIFPCNEIRYGLRSEQLFFGHPTGLASVSFVLILLLLLFSENITSNKIYLICGCILVVSTLRVKAIATILLFLIFYFYMLVFNKKPSLILLVLFSPIIILIGWEQIYGYFFSDVAMDSARGALTYKSIEIAQDFFPLGTGFGTYASAPSAESYSPIYHLYGLSNVWGLSESNPMFVSDVFWPMIISQNGFLGLLIYLCIIVFYITRIQNLYKSDKKGYLLCMGAFIYLLISSTSESAFVNPLSLPLALVIGLCFSVNRQKSILKLSLENDDV